MDENERNRKLKAGREKFHQYLKKKTEESKNAGVIVRIKLAVKTQLCRLCRVKQETEVPGDAEGTSSLCCSTVLPSELKDAVSDASGALDSEFLSEPGICSPELQEFEEAILRRDNVISQLTESLRTTLEQRDTLQVESTKTVEVLTKEIDVLNLQMQNTTEFLKNQKGKNGISAAELLEANNKIIALNQAAVEKSNVIETLNEKVNSLSRNLHSLQLDLKKSENAQKSVESQLRAQNEELLIINSKNREVLRSFNELAEKHKDTAKLLRDREEEISNLKHERLEIENHLHKGFENDSESRDSLLNEEINRLRYDYSELEETFKNNESRYGDIIKKLHLDIETSNRILESNKNDYDSQVNNFTKQIMDLETILSEWPLKLSQEREYFEKEMEEKKNEINILYQLEINNLKEENLTLQMEKEHLQIKRTEMESYELDSNLVDQLQLELQSKNSAIDEHVNELNAMQFTISSLTIDNNEFKNQLDQLLSEKLELHSNLSQAEAASQQLLREKTELEFNLNREKEVLSCVHEELKRKSEEYTDLEIKYLDMNNRFCEQTLEKDGILNLKNNIEGQLRLAEDQIQSLKIALDGDKVIRDEYNQRISSLNETYSNLEATFTSQTEQLLTTQNILEKMTLEKAELEETLNMIKGLLLQANGTLKEVENALSSERLAFANYKEDTKITINAFNDDIDKLKTENSALKLLHSELESKESLLETLQKKLSGLDEQHQVLESHSTYQKKLIDELKLSLSVVNTEKLDAVKRYEELKSEYETSNTMKSEPCVSFAEVQVDMDDSLNWKKKHDHERSKSQSFTDLVNIPLLPIKESLPLSNIFCDKQDSCFSAAINGLNSLISVMVEGNDLDLPYIVNELHGIRNHIILNITNVEVLQNELKTAVSRQEKQNIKSEIALPLGSDTRANLQLRIEELELLLEETNSEKLESVSIYTDLKSDLDHWLTKEEIGKDEAMRWKEKYDKLLEKKLELEMLVNNKFETESGVKEFKPSSDAENLSNFYTFKEKLFIDSERQFSILLKFVSQLIEKFEIQKEVDFNIVMCVLYTLRDHINKVTNVDALQKKLDFIVNEKEITSITQTEDESILAHNQTLNEKCDKLLHESYELKMEIEANKFKSDDNLNALKLHDAAENEDLSYMNSLLLISHQLMSKFNALLDKLNIINDGNLSFEVQQLQEMRQYMLHIFSTERLQRELTYSAEQMKRENIDIKTDQLLELINVGTSLTVNVEDLKLVLQRADNGNLETIAKFDGLNDQSECLKHIGECNKQVPNVRSVEVQVNIDNRSEQCWDKLPQQTLEFGHPQLVDSDVQVNFEEEISMKDECSRLQEKVELKLGNQNIQFDRGSAYLYEPEILNKYDGNQLVVDKSFSSITEPDESKIKKLLTLIDLLLAKLANEENISVVNIVREVDGLRELVVKLYEETVLENDLYKAVDYQEKRSIKVLRVPPLTSDDNSDAKGEQPQDQLLRYDGMNIEEDLHGHDDISSQNQSEAEVVSKLKQKVENLERQLMDKDSNIVNIELGLEAQYEEDVEHVRNNLEVCLAHEVQADVDAEVVELKEKVDADIKARNKENLCLSLALQELKVQVEQLQRDKQNLERSLGGGDLLDDVQIDFDGVENAQSFNISSKYKLGAMDDSSDDPKLSGMHARRLLTYLLGVYLKIGKTVNKELINLIGTDLGVCDVNVTGERSIQFTDWMISEADTESSFVSTTSEDYNVDSAYENLVLETGSKLSVSVQRLLGMLSALVQQLQETPRSSSALNDESQILFDERNEDLVAQLTDEARTKNFLGVELNKTIALLKATETERNNLKDEIIRKEKQLSEMICRFEETKAYSQKLEDSLTEDGIQTQQELVVEDLGESGQIFRSIPVENQCSQLTDSGPELLDENARLQREKRGLQHKVERERSELTARIRELEQVLEESAAAQEIKLEFKAQEISDLQQQIDALEKQLRGYKHFIEEQTLEREQERDDFQRELQKLQDIAKEKDRAQSSEERLSREVESWQEQVKEKTELYKQLFEKKEQLEKELEILLEKSKSDQDVIRDLERQLDCKSRSEKMLNEQMDKLQSELDHSSRIHHEQSIEIEQLRKISVSSQLNVSQAFYEEYFDGSHLDVGNPPSPEAVLLELRSQVQNLEYKVSRHSLDLEGLLVVTSCLSSPCSEEVSVREQLEVLRSKENERLSKSENVEPTFNAFLKDIRLLEEKVDSLSRSRDIVLKKLKDYEAQIVRQRHTEEELQQDRDMLQQKVNAQLLQITSLQSRIEKRRFGIEDEEITAKLLELQDELEKERQLVDCKTKQIEEFQECVTDLQQQCNSLKKQNFELTQRYSSDINVHKLTQSAAATELNENKQRNEILKNDLLKTQKQLEDVSSLLQSVVTEKNKEIDMMATEAQMLERHNDELKRTLENLETKLSNSLKGQQQLAAAQETIKKLTEDINGKEEKLNDTERDLKKSLEVVEQKRREVEALKVVMEEKAQLAEQVATLRAEVDHLTNYQACLQEDFDTVQSMLEERQIELSVAQQEVSELNAYKVVAMTDKTNLLQEMKNVQDRFDAPKVDSEVQVDIGDLDLSKLTEQDTRIQFLSTELNNLSSVTDALSENLKTEEKKVSSLTKNLKSVKNKLQESEANVNHLSNELEKSNNELKQTKDELNQSLKLKSRLEAEISWRDTKIFRIEDELEQLKVVKSDGEGNVGKVTLYKFLEEVRQEVIRESENLNLNDSRTAESSDGFLEPFRPDAKSLRQRDDGRGSTSPGPSASSSDVESVTSETLPPPVRSLMRKVYKEGIHVLNLSELNAVQEQLPTDAPVEDMNRTMKQKNWANEKRYLVAEIDALKELLTHITNVAAASRVTDSAFSAIPEVLRGVMKLVSNDRNAVLEDIVEILKNKNFKNEKLEKCVSELMAIYTIVLHTIQKATLKLGQVSQITSDTKANAWEVQMAVAKERMSNQTEQKKLLNQLQTLELQLGLRERQLKRQAELLEFRVQQEQLISEDLRRNLEMEKSRCIELSSQLALERSRVAHMDLNIAQLKSDLTTSQITLEQEKHDLHSTMQQLKNEKSTVESYVQALQTERVNFTQLQEAMEADKRRSKSSCQRDHQIIEELRQALITERDKQLELTTLLESERIALQNARQELLKAHNSCNPFQTEGYLDGVLSHGSNEDFSSALTFERKKSTDLVFALQKEQHKVSVLTSSLQQDRKQLLDELDSTKESCSRLQSKLEFAETQKSNLLKEAQRNREEIHRLELENEKFDSELGILQNIVYQKDQEIEQLRRVQREMSKNWDVERELERQKMQELKLELRKLQQTVASNEREIEMIKRSETLIESVNDLDQQQKIKQTLYQSVRYDVGLSRTQIINLETLIQRMSLLLLKIRDDVSGLLTNELPNAETFDTFSLHIKSVLSELDSFGNDLQMALPNEEGLAVHLELMEKIVKHNGELAEFALRLSENKLSLREMVMRGKNELDSLKWTQGTCSVHPVSSNMTTLSAERAIWAQERTRLQQSLHKAEADLIRASSRHLTITSLDDHADDIKVLRQKYLRAESFRKNLAFQKTYLLLLLSGYQYTESGTLDVLGRLGCLVNSRHSGRVEHRHSRAFQRFRSAVRLIGAIFRMKFLVRKWRRTNSNTHSCGTPIRDNSIDKFSVTSSVSYTPSNHSQSRRFSCNSGTTPPAKDSLRNRLTEETISNLPFVSTSRSSSGSSNLSANGRLSEYVRRFDNIQQQLGIIVKQPNAME
ncbi:hypothetical protein CHUAL_007359 [Chamberlinius hualienensis]